MPNPVAVRWERKWVVGGNVNRESAGIKQNPGNSSRAVSMTLPLDLLVVAPHPDDAEIGVGGTLLLSKSQGLSVGVIDLTSGEPTPHGSLEIRARETAAATKVP